MPTPRPDDKTPLLPARPTSGAPPIGNAERYVLGEELGRGGLGRVVEAWDPELKRTVAVKLVLENLPPELLDRFRREAELTAQLEHPNIVPVHDIWQRGEGSSRRLFLAMKRIRGRNLATLLKDLARGDTETVKTYSRARLLRVFQDICLGIAYAHANGVIHRDLKPSNVMIGPFGETLIVDWGLAKSVTGPAEAPAGDGRAALAGNARLSDSTVPLDNADLTMEGQIVGTSAYMSPEQAGGHVAEIGPRSDVYSLGAILYEILTLRPPVEGKTLAEVITRVRTGAVALPSSLGSALIPPELDAICLKALALRKEDRTPSAIALHDDIQLFLEGVKERERKSREALERVASGRRWSARYGALEAEIAAQEEIVADWRERIKPHQPAEEKRPLWEAMARARSMREERINAYSKATAEFAQALTVDSSSTEASDGICDLILGRFLEAEERRDRDQMLLERNTLAQYDRGGKYLARLEAPGKVTIRTQAFRCDCLSPVRHPDWRVEIADDVTVPWREGRARPDLPLTDDDGPVPVVATFPPGVRYGHSPACTRHEVAGVEVSIARYEEHDNRFVLGPERVLGRTPLAGAEVPRGSWVCFLRGEGFAPVRLPVLIERSATWEQDVNLYRPEEIPAGFCVVPGGPFTFGGTEARKRQPRHSDRKWWIEQDGRFALPPTGSDPSMEWDPRWPVMSIDWFDAKAYCSWKSKLSGVRHELMHEQEYEKACRGVDGRMFSYGDIYEGPYSHTSVSLPGKMTPLPVGSFPVDESPYGIRDLSGGMETWCSNAPEAPFRTWRCQRGGAWGSTSTNARSAYRHGIV
ncbi:MAG: protein kinase, partial [Planctomycetes bacterium]|nr:protein kinase [Planctomycetota bacterium]